MAKATEQDYIIGVQTKGAKESTKDLANFAKELKNLQKITNKLELKSLKSIWKNTGWSKDQIKQASVLTRSDQRYSEKNLSQREAKRQTELQVASWQLQRNAESGQLAQDRLKTEQAITDEVYQQQRAKKLSVDVQQQEIDGYNRTNARLKWMEEHLPEIVDQEKRRDELNNRIAKATGRQQTALGKLGKTLKRVGFYRVARLFYSTLEKGLSQGLSGFAKFDKQANETMSSIMSSVKVLTASIGSVLMPLLEALEPAIKAVSVTFANVGNAISKANAEMKGMTTYTKVNTEYMEKYGEETKKSLLSFDKFETLSGADENSPYETADIKDAEDSFSGIAEIFLQLKDIISEILSMVKPLFDIILYNLKQSMPFIENIVKIVSGFINILAGLFNVMTGNFDDAWQYIKKGFVKMGEGLINLMINLINHIIQIILMPIKGVFQLFDKIFGSNTASFFDKIKIPNVDFSGAYAQGGVPDKGSLFYAGEAGAELVHSMPSGNTGVTNVAQFKQAMVEAIYECSDVFYGGEGTVVLNLDGAEVARSRRFKAELNRTNSGLNLV